MASEYGGTCSVTTESDACLGPGNITEYLTTSPQYKHVDADIQYKMTYPKRGKAIIINNERFYDSKGNVVEIREGSGTDVKNLQESFQRLGFEVKLHTDSSREQMTAVLYSASKESHDKCDCIAVCILSHGDEGVVLGKYLERVEISLLTEFFHGDKCLSLAGKPKLFFIQACRGPRSDEGVVVKFSGSGMTDTKQEQRIPVAADFLLAYSTVPDYGAFRDVLDGSWFIQALCQVLNFYGAEKDLLWMMTRVNKMVAYDFESNNLKQIPCISSMLTKDLFFSPKST